MSSTPDSSNSPKHAGRGRSNRRNPKAHRHTCPHIGEPTSVPRTGHSGPQLHPPTCVTLRHGPPKAGRGQMTKLLPWLLTPPWQNGQSNRRPAPSLTLTANTWRCAVRHYACMGILLCYCYCSCYCDCDCDCYCCYYYSLQKVKHHVAYLLNIRRYMD